MQRASVATPLPQILLDWLNGNHASETIDRDLKQIIVDSAQQLVGLGRALLAAHFPKKHELAGESECKDAWTIHPRGPWTMSRRPERTRGRGAGWQSWTAIAAVSAGWWWVW